MPLHKAEEGLLDRFDLFNERYLHLFFQQPTTYNSNNNREFIERFQRLKALYNLKTCNTSLYTHIQITGLEKQY